MNKILFGLLLLLLVFFIIGIFSGLPQPSTAVTITPTNNPNPPAILPRQGVAAASWYSVPNSRPYLNQFGAWAYNWEADASDFPETRFQLIPMLVEEIDMPNLTAVMSIDSNTPDHDYWLVYSECETQGSCDRAATLQADYYHNNVLPLVYDNCPGCQGGDPNAKLIVGGTTTHPCGFDWMGHFVEHYRNQYGEVPRAGWHFHIYPGLEPNIPGPDVWDWSDGCTNLIPWQPFATHGVTDFSNFMIEIQRIKQWLAVYGSPKDEVWITEIGCLLNSEAECLPSNNDTMAEYIGAITHYLNSDEGRWITRYAWFTEQQQDGLWPATWLIEDLTVPTPVFTDAGDYYAQITPSAYEPKFFYVSFSPTFLKSDVTTYEFVTPEPPPAGYPPPQSPYP